MLKYCLQFIHFIRVFCNKSVEFNNLVSSCQQASWEQAVRTLPGDKLLEQHCYKFALVSGFYVCTYVKSHKLLQVPNLLTSCRQDGQVACSHCLFLVVITSMEQAVNNL